MFTVKDKKLLPYQFLLFGALGLYLYRLNKSNQDGMGNSKVSIDTEKLSRMAAPFLPIRPDQMEPVSQGIKRTLDVVLEKIKK